MRRFSVTTRSLLLFLLIAALGARSSQATWSIVMVDPDPAHADDIPNDRRTVPNLERLTAALYPELRRLAQGAMRREGPKHTLQPTALVHEAFLRLVRPDAAGWENKRHFLRVAARAMRQILTDYARQQNAVKRSGSRNRCRRQAEGIGARRVGRSARV